MSSPRQTALAASSTASLLGDGDAQLAARPASWISAQPARGEGARARTCTSPPRKRAERRVHVIEARIGELERHRLDAEAASTAARAARRSAGHSPSRTWPRVRSQTQSPAPSRRMPSGRCRTSSIMPARLRACAKARSKCASSPCRSGWRKRASSAIAVHHHGGIGGEDEIGQARPRAAPVRSRRRASSACDGAPRHSLSARWRRAPAPRWPSSPGSIHGLIE